MTAMVVFIHGEWLSASAWDSFQRRYAACGYTCIAPPWPGLEGPAKDLRNAPCTHLSRLGIASIVAHYEHLIRELAHPPLLIGHSLGGLFVQMLLDRGLGSAGIAIAAVPPAGTLPHLRFLYHAVPLCEVWGGWRRVLHLPRETFARGIGQSSERQALDGLYERHHVPTPGRVFFEAALGIGTRVDFANDRRAPLLLICADNDRTILPREVACNYRHHRRSVARTTLKRFSGHTHWLISEPGWEEIADYTIEWAHTRLGRF